MPATEGAIHQDGTPVKLRVALVVIHPKPHVIKLIRVLAYLVRADNIATAVRVSSGRAEIISFHSFAASAPLIDDAILAGRWALMGMAIPADKSTSAIEILTEALTSAPAGPSSFAILPVAAGGAAVAAVPVAAVADTHQRPRPHTRLAAKRSGSTTKTALI